MAGSSPWVRYAKRISALLRERQVSAGRMHDHIAALDSRLHGGRILVVSAACGNELRIDGADLRPAGMVGLNPVCYFHQLADRCVDIGKRAILFEFHVPASGHERFPAGPRHIDEPPRCHLP
jgi:hypothetical protein